MENFPKKTQELEEQELLEELTPEETEALKGGFLFTWKDYFPIGIPYPGPWFDHKTINPELINQSGILRG